MGYLGNFIVYTLAMVGVIVVALLVFKNSTVCGIKNNGKLLKVIDTMSLAPRKTLYIIEANGEKFLVAGDTDRTTLISKLEIENKTIEKFHEELKKVQQEDSLRSSYIDRQPMGINRTQNKPYNSALKNLAERIRG